MEVMDAGAVEVVGGARMQGGRPCFLNLPLPHLEIGVHSSIIDLYNIYKIEI